MSANTNQLEQHHCEQATFAEPPRLIKGTRWRKNKQTNQELNFQSSFKAPFGGDRKAGRGDPTEPEK